MLDSQNNFLVNIKEKKPVLKVDKKNLLTK